MTQEFQIGDEVEITATGERFQIKEIWQNRAGLIQYSDIDQAAWSPASALRKIEELKVGDWVEVIGQPCGLRGEPIGGKTQIIDIRDNGDCLAGKWWYVPANLHKLAPSEIPGQSADSRLDEIRAALLALASDTGKRFEKIATDMKRIEAEFEKRRVAFNSLSERAEKRLSFLESLAKEHAGKEELEAKRLSILREIANDMRFFYDRHTMPQDFRSREAMHFGQLFEVEKQLAEGQ
jgi:hypothetical protein